MLTKNKQYATLTRTRVRCPSIQQLINIRPLKNDTHDSLTLNNVDMKLSPQYSNHQQSHSIIMNNPPDL